MSKTPNPIDVHVGGRVRFRRMMLGVSQEKLGEKLGLTFQQIQKYEKGANRIGASRLYRIAQVLGVSVDFFFQDLPEDLRDGVGDSNPKPESDPMMGFLGSVEGLQLNAAYASIEDQDVRRRVLDLIKALASKDAIGQVADQVADKMSEAGPAARLRRSA